MNYESMSLWVAVASLIVAITALLVAIGANRIAESSLSQAKQVADRDQRDWRQRKWFDLYFQDKSSIRFTRTLPGSIRKSAIRRIWHSRRQTRLELLDVSYTGIARNGGCVS